MQINKSDDIINYFYQNLEKNYNEIVHYDNKKIFKNDICFNDGILNKKENNGINFKKFKCINCLLLQKLKCKNGVLEIKTGAYNGEKYLITENIFEELKIKLLLYKLQKIKIIIGVFKCKNIYSIERIIGDSYINFYSYLNVDVNIISRYIEKKLSLLSEYNFFHGSLCIDKCFFIDEISNIGDEIFNFTIYFTPGENSKFKNNISYIPVENFQYSYVNEYKEFRKFFKIGKYKNNFLKSNYYSKTFDLACILSSLYLVNKEFSNCEEWKKLWRISEIKKVENELDNIKNKENNFQEIYNIISKFYIII